MFCLSSLSCAVPLLYMSSGPQPVAKAICTFPSFLMTTPPQQQPTTWHLFICPSKQVGISAYSFEPPRAIRDTALPGNCIKSKQDPTYGGALRRLAVGHGGVMHDNCIARGSLVCGILCKVRLCTHPLWVISCHPTIPTSHVRHTPTNTN